VLRLALDIDLNHPLFCKAIPVHSTNSDLWLWRRFIVVKAIYVLRHALNIDLSHQLLGEAIPGHPTNLDLWFCAVEAWGFVAGLDGCCVPVETGIGLWRREKHWPGGDCLIAMAREAAANQPLFKPHCRNSPLSNPAQPVA
jgi:hypothetical protein